APAELASRIVETVASGRRQAIEQIGSMMGGDVLPGISFVEAASGTRPAQEMIDSIMSAAMDRLPEQFRSRVQRMREGSM
ncbi:MAG TPA: hypothetical protein VGQ99_07780, partial [Tepidisphaeraceae bacterium]|nr:hypothetical protein [Tepidisphaeraceae bacterium]